MKKLCFSILSSLIPFSFCVAQNTFPSSGNVGIGTLSPTDNVNGNVGTVLDVNSAGSNNSIVVLHTGGTSNSGGGAFSVQSNLPVSGSNFIGQIAFQRISDVTPGRISGAIQFALNNDGNISIPMTIQPTGNIGVNGSVNAIGNYGVFALNGRSASQGGYMSFLTNGQEKGAIVSNSQFNIQAAPNTTTQFYTGTQQTLQIAATGNVGIGTINPDERLTVYGTVHARAVKVDLAGPLADYVFEPSYRLETINSVKNYLSKYKHLKGIPSANDAAKNGLNLGELNQKLLQKVEELTLYLIEEHRQNQLNKAKISKLEKSIESLSKPK